MDNKITPLPCYISGGLSDSGNIHIDADGITIAKITPCENQQANAAYIVMAVNLHEELIRKLKQNIIILRDEGHMTQAGECEALISKATTKHDGEI